MLKVITEGANVYAYNGNWEFNLRGDDCIGCGLCTPECPHDALYEQEWAIGGGGELYTGASLIFNSAYCQVGDCGNYCEGVCPTVAIRITDKTPQPPPPTYCELYPFDCMTDAYGESMKGFFDNISNVYVPKTNSILQSEAAKWGMTAEVYLADKLGLIAESGSMRSLGNIARAAGWAGAVYGSYNAVVAVSDGRLTANELLGIASTTLGVIALVPGVGTAVGLGGLALISAGSLVLGLISNTEIGKATTVINFNNLNL